MNELIHSYHYINPKTGKQGHFTLVNFSGTPAEGIAHIQNIRKFPGHMGREFAHSHSTKVGGISPLVRTPEVGGTPLSDYQKEFVVPPDLRAVTKGHPMHAARHKAADEAEAKAKAEAEAQSPGEESSST